MINQEDKKIKYFPFHAINEFMRNDYRLNVVRTVLSSVSDLSNQARDPIDRYTRKYVKVPGFRNSTKAPVGVRIKPTVEAFENNPDLVAAILSAWSEINHILRQQVYDLLISRGWNILPVEADRKKLPGFLTTWPQGENFENLVDAFKDTYPDDIEGDDISLMIVWLSARLPYQEEQS